MSASAGDDGNRAFPSGRPRAPENARLPDLPQARHHADVACEHGSTLNPPSPPFTQIPGHINDHDSVRPLRQQMSRENPGALVVKKILVPLPFDELRQKRRDDTIGFFRPTSRT